MNQLNEKLASIRRQKSIYEKQINETKESSKVSK